MSAVTEERTVLSLWGSDRNKLIKELVFWEMSWKLVGICQGGEGALASEEQHEQKPGNLKICNSWGIMLNVVHYIV